MWKFHQWFDLYYWFKTPGMEPEVWSDKTSRNCLSTLHLTLSLKVFAATINHSSQQDEHRLFIVSVYQHFTYFFHGVEDHKCSGIKSERVTIPPSVPLKRLFHQYLVKKTALNFSRMGRGSGAYMGRGQYRGSPAPINFKQKYQISNSFRSKFNFVFLCYARLHTSLFLQFTSS